MNQRIAYISLLVKDYDEAISFYTNKLQFEIIEDSILSDQKRWVVLSPSDQSGCAILLAKAVNEEQYARIGNQTGGRVFLFLTTDNFRRDYQNLVGQGVAIVRQPTEETYGTVAVFADLYGNLWDLIEPGK